MSDQETTERDAVAALAEKGPDVAGPLVKHAREALGLTQQQLADCAKTSQGSIARIEQATAARRPQVAAKLLRTVLQALADRGIQFNAQRIERTVPCSPNLAFRVPGRVNARGGFAPDNPRHLPIIMQHRGLVRIPESEAKALEREGSFEIVAPDDPLHWIV